jgi:hypothetical protein
VITIDQLSFDLAICDKSSFQSPTQKLLRERQMSNTDAKRLESDLDDQQTQIETIEVQLNLKDASVASECEVNHLQAAQQVHRDNIHELKKSLDEREPTE